MAYWHCRRLWLAFPLALAAALAAVYWAGLFGEFAFDDFASIVGNTVLRSGSDRQNTWMAAANSGFAGPLGRGLSMLSFAFNYRLFGEAAFSFKLTNLLIHYANALLVLTLVRQVLPLLYPALDPKRTAAVAMLVCTAWALHPMNALPVLYVVQRMTSLSAFFMLAGISLYLVGRRAKTAFGRSAIAVSLLFCWPAALLSKETGVLLLVYLFLCEWLLLRSFHTLAPKFLRMFVPTAGVVLLVLGWANWNAITSGYGVRDFDLQERLLTEARVLWFYIQQLVLPVPGSFGLYLDDIAVSRGLLSPATTLLSIIGWLVVLVLAYLQRLRWSGFSFAVFWFLGSHLLESTVLPLELVFEHRNYLASLGLLAWLGCIALPVASVSRTHWVRVTLVLGFVSYCAFVSSLRASQWADDYGRRQVEVYNHPRSARAHYEMAVSLQQRTFEAGHGSADAYRLIQNHLRTATELDQNSKLAPLGLLYLDCIAGIPQNSATTVELLHRFRTQRFTHLDRNAVQSLSPMLVNNKLCLSPQGVQALLEAGISNPLIDNSLRGSFYAVSMDYALAYLRDSNLALQYAQAAVAVAPAELSFSSNLIRLFLQSGQWEAAKSEYSRLSAQSIAASDPAAIFQLKALIESAQPHATLSR
nr:hypothetical protein [Rhodoferax sp.]